MAMTGVAVKCFIYGLNRVEVIGLPKFLDLLDSRRDPENRERGLITGTEKPLDPK
jgi:monolysocardiolipin acyltransferase